MSWWRNGYKVNKINEQSIYTETDTAIRHKFVQLFGRFNTIVSVPDYVKLASRMYASRCSAMKLLRDPAAYRELAVRTIIMR